MHSDSLWQTKLHARLHDPAEKALILMRTAHGHEGGTSRALHNQLFPNGIPAAVKDAVKSADRWASAADRAAFPSHDDDGRYPKWKQVEFPKDPVIIHPLTGQSLSIGKLSDIQPAQAEALSLEHFKSLVQPDDLQKTALAFWRFGPDIRAAEIQSLWSLLPADTRVPDHSIWDHLDLTAALASAFVYDDQGPALLAVSLGPVQDFIAASRSTSDLWAGSHLLSRLAWEAMKVICADLGPEAILFPRLRGIPQVDLWLQKDCGLPAGLFAHCDWTKSGSDANPLFAAALPNRFTALVPASQAKVLGEKITAHVRQWVLTQGERAYQALLSEAGVADDPSLPGYAQLKEQLAGFPEVHWSAVPWSLVATDSSGRVDASSTALADAMRPFFGEGQLGYLGSDAWRLLSQDILLEDGWFWRPNPGALYPALHELLERLLAATKSLRAFAPSTQTGFRCSLTGESEWLTTDRSQLALPPGQRSETLWTKVAKKRPAWAKKGEHLGALATLKRLWPNLFVAECEDVLGKDITRFVVSTHTLALATSLSAWLKREKRIPDSLKESLRAAPSSGNVALPRKLAASIANHPDKDWLYQLPGWLENAREAEEDSDSNHAERQLEELFDRKLETYFALVLMDGDHMGAWLSADRDKTLPHQSAFHPQVQAGLQKFMGDKTFKAYAESLRAANPARHMAISDALNNFALTLAPAVVEQQHHGRVLYAGGDDVMAMLPVSDLLSAMSALRAAYSGVAAASVGAQEDDVQFQQQANGFVLHKNRLLRLMGGPSKMPDGTIRPGATASIGAVIAHHQAPLGAVLRELHLAEKRAKNDGGRDAFSLTVIKRSGGALYLTCKWSLPDGDSPMACLRELSDALKHQDASRRATYHVQAWTTDLPEPSQLRSESYQQMLSQMMAYQFKRQGLDNPQVHAQRLAEMAATHTNAKGVAQFINNFLSVAEFLARESRA